MPELLKKSLAHTQVCKKLIPIIYKETFRSIVCCYVYEVNNRDSKESKGKATLLVDSSEVMDAL